MKNSRILEERIRRVTVLFKELGCDLGDEQKTADLYTCEIKTEKEFHGSVLIDRNNKFMEMAYSFSFSPRLQELLKKYMEEVIRICYEYGCYFNFFTTKNSMTFSLFTKMYFSGMNFYSLRDSFNDFKNCVAQLSGVINFRLFNNTRQGGVDENT